MTDRVEWHDITSYGRGGPKLDEEPSTWACESGTVRVIVTRHIVYGPREWVMRCDALSTGLVSLGELSADEARAAALRLVRRRVTTLSHDVSRLPEVAQ